mmetsp:Transcript_10681/g.25707  ORF Transcript_10681/g.25707 Transcript_10681/m.25707 type:complete len:335 (+) Transcript_10681:87-1091(+)
MTIKDSNLTAAKERDPNRAGFDATISEEKDQAASTNIAQESTKREPCAEQNLSVNDDSITFENGDGRVERAEERKIKHWKDSEFAVGCVNVTWEDDHPSWWFGSRHNNDGDNDNDDSVHADNRFAISSIVCGCLGAGRVGNMAVLAQSTENFEEEVVDPDTGEVTTIRKARPKLLWVMGPYWTVNLCITFPLIFGISGWICYQRIAGSNSVVMITWSIGTFLMVFSLCMISCRNPGILYRHSQIPSTVEEDWRWNDQARTYRPASARFDSECQVVVEGFDHTCPWTGTAIGSKNMFWFKIFVCMIPIMLVYTFIVAAFGGRGLPFFTDGNGRQG